MQSSKALPFVYYNKDGAVEVSLEASRFLESLPPQQKVCVLSIAGKYRTGKSFFVNRVLLGLEGKGGFEVSPTINACTKGLWLWGSNLFPEKEGQVTLLLDTEGFGAVQESTTYDTKIFLIGLLVSSLFIFNSVGSIDEQALNTVDLVLHLARQISAKSNAKYQPEFPFFYWVIRDFALQIVDRDGHQMSENEYLERALQETKGGSETADNKNRIRRGFKKYFPRRDCKTLVIPCEQEKDLKRLSELSNRQLRPEFVRKAVQIRADIIKKTVPKLVNFKPLNGRSFLEMVRYFVQAVNDGAVPDIEGAWTFVSRTISDKALEECLLRGEQLLGEASEEQYEAESERIRALVRTQFERECLVEGEEREKVLRLLDRRLTQVSQVREAEVKAKLTDIYRNVIDKSLAPLKTAESPEEIQQQLRLLKEEYERLPESSLKWQLYHQHTDGVISQSLERAKELQVEQAVMQLQLSRSQQLSLKQAESQTESLKAKLRQAQQQLSALALQAAAREEDARRESRALLEQQKERIKELEDRLGKAVQEGFQRQLNARQDVLSKRLRQFEDKLQHMENSHLESVNQLKNLLGKKDRESQALAHEYEMKVAECRQAAQRQSSKGHSLQLRLAQLEAACRDKDQALARVQAESDRLRREVGSLGKALRQKQEQAEEESERRSTIERQYNQWNHERNCLEGQIGFLRTQLDQNRRLHDALILALEQSVQESEHNQVVSKNKVLQSTLQKAQATVRVQEAQLKELAKMKRLLRSASLLVCGVCGKEVRSQNFSTHVRRCGSKQNVGESPPWKDIFVSIIETNVIQGTDGKPYTQFVVEVIAEVGKVNVVRKLKHFAALHSALKAEKLALPEAVEHLFLEDLVHLYSARRSTQIEERRKHLQQYLRQLLKVPGAQERPCLSQFLGICDH